LKHHRVRGAGQRVICERPGQELALAIDRPLHQRLADALLGSNADAMDAGRCIGGYKMSGYGRESGIQQMEEYLNVKAVWIRIA
jgi:hypothetical protein